MNPPADESYASRLARRFRRDAVALTGLRLIIVAFVIAALAPFLANDHAIVRVADGQLSFPVFRSLEPIEWRFLLYVPLAGIVYVLRGPLFRQPSRGILIVGGIAIAIQVALLFTHTYNDVTKPVHNRAIGRWKNYAETLAPVQAQLAPYLRNFRYD